MFGFRLINSSFFVAAPYASFFWFFSKKSNVFLNSHEPRMTHYIQKNIWKNISYILRLTKTFLIKCAVRKLE